jgi:hypothetical protein
LSEVIAGASGIRHSPRPCFKEGNHRNNPGRFVSSECAVQRIRRFDNQIRKVASKLAKQTRLLFPLGQFDWHMQRRTDHPRAAIDVALVSDERFQVQHKFFGKHG